MSPCLVNLHAEYIRQNARLDEALAEIKNVGEISIAPDIQMTSPSRHKAKKN